MRLTPEFVSQRSSVSSSSSHLSVGVMLNGKASECAERARIGAKRCVRHLSRADGVGLQIPLIENLASHQGTYDTLNLTDNSITVLGNIPLGKSACYRSEKAVKRNGKGLATVQAWRSSLKQRGSREGGSGDATCRERRGGNAARFSTETLLTFNSTEIATITCGAESDLVHIPILIAKLLSHNLIAALATLSPLENLPYLRHLSLSSNPVTEQPHYRPYTIYKVAKGLLRTLDYTRIKDAERSTAKAQFTDEATGGPNALALTLSTSIAPATSGAPAAAPSAFALAQKTGQPVKGGKGRLMTPEEKKRVVEALTKAQTADEVRRLERMLAEGLIPEGQGVEGVTGPNAVEA